MKSPKHQVEALLFSSGKTMTVESLSELSKLPKDKVTRALKALKKDYAEKDGAMAIEQDGNGWKMTVTTEHLPLVKSIVADTELSRACMETLAVIAYKAPVLQSDVVDTRGGGAYEHIAELDKLGFLSKKRSGRSYEIRLSDRFFEYFEVTGKDIRKAFKGVKPREKQKQLSGMDVVMVPEEGPLGDMEVVNVSRHKEKPHFHDPEKEKKPDAASDEEHMKFLDDLDKKIDKLAEQNDKHEDDPMLQRMSAEEETEDEQEAEEETATSEEKHS